jgi:hypothetical protein
VRNVISCRSAALILQCTDANQTNNHLTLVRVGTKEVFLSLSHPPGEAQVDFGFAQVLIDGVATQRGPAATLRATSSRGQRYSPSSIPQNNLEFHKIQAFHA